MLITPDEPPEARRGCPSKTDKINKPINTTEKHQKKQLFNLIVICNLLLC
jgi:hypothetical protein